MKQNVYLIDLGTGTNRNLLPLGIALITSYCRNIAEINNHYNIETIFLRPAHNESISEGLREPFLVGFACYQWNFNASMMMAQEIKRAYPGCITVCGSYCVPNPDEPEKLLSFFYKHPYIDILVHEEGELTFADILLTLKNGSQLSDVEGVSYQDSSNQRGFHNTTRRRDQIDLNAIPSPFLNGLFDALISKHGSKITGAIWETTRGCPYSCAYCAWGKLDGRRLRSVHLDRLFKELEWMSANKIYYVSLADANFGILFDRDLKIVQRIAELRKSTGYPGYCAFNWVKNNSEKIIKIVDVFHNVGITSPVTLSAQSFNSDTLKAIRRINMKQSELIKLKSLYRERGFNTYTEFILGLPKETYESFRDGLEQAMTPSLSDHFTIYLCSLLENADLSTTHYRQEYGIESRNVSMGAGVMSRRRFDKGYIIEHEEIIVGTESMSVHEWQRSYDLGYLSIALYDLRLAFFLMNVFHDRFHMKHTEFLEYLIQKVSSEPQTYPALNKGLEYLSNQRAEILSGGSTGSEFWMLKGMLLGPIDMLTHIFLEDAEAFYHDLSAIAMDFSVHKGNKIDAILLEDIIRYQKARIPTWPLPKNRPRHSFTFNIHEYFEKLTTGHKTLEPIHLPNEIEILVPDDFGKTYEEFSFKRLVGGYILTPYKVKPLTLYSGSQN